jgi:hypothetical protein
MSLIYVTATVLVALFGYVAYRVVRARRGWQAVADAYGLSCTRGGPFAEFQMQGNANGYPLTVETEAPSGFEDPRRTTRFKVTLGPEFPRGLTLFSRTEGDEEEARFAGPEVEVGRDELERHFAVKGGPVDEIVPFLDDRGIEQALVGLHRVARRVELQNGKLVLERQYLTHRQSDLEATVDRLLNCAELLDRRSETSA